MGGDRSDGAALRVCQRACQRRGVCGTATDMHPLENAAPKRFLERATGIEPATFSLGKGHADVSGSSAVRTGRR